MRPLAIANVEQIETQPFLVCNLYGEDGYLLDQLIKPYYSPKRAAMQILELGQKYGVETLELWTSNHFLYAETLEIVGLAGHIKHKDKTSDTKKAAEQTKDILIELYEIDLIKPKPKLSKFRRGLFFMVKWLEKIVTGGEKYEI